MNFIASSARLFIRSFIRPVWLSFLFVTTLFFCTQSRITYATAPSSAVNAPLAQITLIRYVDRDALGAAPDGLGWSTAFTNVQHALTQAATLVPTDTVEIWVAEGVYYPDQGIGQTNNNISATFQLKTDVALYGGFAGNESSRSQRNWTTQRTILSGDIDGNGNASNNALHVITSIGVTKDAILDGFVITAGGADSGSSCPFSCGGGMYNDSTSVATLTNLLFIGNHAAYGGAMYNTNFSRPALNNIIFNANSARFNGGAMYNNGVNLTAVHVLFYGNHAASHGGGVFHTSISSIGSKFRNAIFWKNSAGTGETDLYNDLGGSSPGGSDVSYGLIESGCPAQSTCDNWFSANPKFTDVDGSDNITGTLDDNFYLLATSPAIDVGLDSHTKTQTDFADKTRKIDGDGNATATVDLGPYEYQGFDLRLSMTVTPTAVVPGATITYTLQFSNVGILPATGVVLTSTLSPQVTVVSVNKSGVAITQTSTSPLAWKIADLAPASSGMITISAVITGATWVASTSVITADPSDILPVNNSSTANVYLTGVRYVNKNAVGPIYTGASWTTAYTTVQDALVGSFAGDEIWVTEGTYYPDEGSGQIGNKEESSFTLKNGVKLYAGFSGSETSRNQRDWQNQAVVLSGDIDQNDTVDPLTAAPIISGTNAYHVVTGDGTNSSAILDGFTIRNGYANGGTDNPCYARCGGGMITVDGSPTLVNLTFFGNKSIEDGAGIFNNNSSPSLSNILFSANHATSDGGGIYNTFNSHPLMDTITFTVNQADNDGGGLYNFSNSNPVVSNALFNANFSDSDGGGVYNYTSNPTFTHVIFQNNQATTTGGGMASSYSSIPKLSNVTFSGNYATNGGGVINDRTSHALLMDVAFFNNRATAAGGGMYNLRSSSPLITNTTFISNTSATGAGVANNNSSPTLNNVLFVANVATAQGGGVYNTGGGVAILNNVTLINNSATTSGGAIYNNSSSPQIRNSIAWGNSPTTQIQGNAASHPVITYTLVQAACSSGQSCYGIVQANPAFRDINGADNITGTLDDDAHLLLGSPMIDVGSNSFVAASLTNDLDHKPRLIDGDGNSTATVDLGAYEFQRYDLQISMALTPIQPLPFGNITYTIWYSNAGPSSAEGVVITNNLPISVALTGSSSSGAAITQTGSSPLRWQVTDLAAGAGGMITLTGTITDQAWILNEAFISANYNDANTANNYAAVDFYLTGLRFVKQNATGPGQDGLSWATAFITLQDALAAAQPGDEIWVASGIYRPDEGGAKVDNDVNASFQLMNDIAIYGGFAGNEVSRNQRNWTTHVTVLSADIDKNDTVNGNGVVITTSHQSGVNARHVVSGTNLNSSARLDGFTITAGNANTSGGGLYNSNGSPTLSNLIFSANQATVEGGGMANVNNSAPSMTNILFYANRAASGGGMSNSQGSGPTLSQVAFYGNLAPAGKGGGMYNYSSFATVVNGSFVANQAGNGGGIYNEYLSTPNLTNVTFSANQATNGSAIYNINNSGPTLTHVTLASNTASSTGVIFNDSSNPSIRNSIIWGNSPSTGSAVSGGTPTIANSLIERACASGQTCAGILQADPKLGSLVDLGNSMFVYPLLPGSHVIDAGNDTYCPSTDQRSIARPQGNHCDLGASETFQADLKGTGMSAPEPFTPGGALNYTFNITNSGSYTATGVVVTATLSAQTVYNSNNCGVGSVTNNVLVWNIGELAVNASRTCVVTVVVNNSVGGAISSTVIVGGNLHDPVTSNNQAVVNSISNVPTATPTATVPPTATPTSTPTPLPTATATQTNVNTPTATASPVAPSATPSATFDPSATATNTATATPTTGTPPPTNTPAAGDQDGDGIVDSVECSPTCVDSDGDGKQNQMDVDSDSDGIPDKIEAASQGGAASAGAPINSDDDALADYLDADSDNDSLSDWLEGYDANFDGKSDVQKANSDSDGDGLDDAFDTPAMNERMNSASPAFPDLDGDGPNWRDANDDNDAVLTRDEVGSDPANPLDLDTNGIPDYLQEAVAVSRVFLPVVTR